MSYKAMDFVFDQDIKDPLCKFVLLTIAKHSDEAMRCFPSIARIAKLTGLSRSTVKVKLNALEEAGWVRVTRRAKDGKRQTSIYTLQKPNNLIGRQTAQEYINTNNNNNLYISLSMADTRPTNLQEQEKELLELARLSIQEDK